MLSDTTLAEDAAQEVFLKAYQSLGHFQMKASFSTWLYRIASNHCLDLLRKKSREKTESWEMFLEKESQQIEALFSVPHEHFSEEQTELLYRFLSHLSKTSRNIIVLRELDGLSYEEIAKTLDCSLDAVKSRLKRARLEMMETARHFFHSPASKS